MGARLAEPYLRGRLARRLLLVFVLGSVIPVLLTSFISYEQLIRGADAASARALHDQAKESALAFLSQLQSANAELRLLEPFAGTSRAREMAPAPFSAISFVPVGTAAQWRDALKTVPRAMRAPLMAGRTALISGRRDGRAELWLILLQPAHARLAIGRLDAGRMLAQARPMASDTGIALADSAMPARLIRSDGDPVPRQVFEQLAVAGIGGAARTLQDRHHAGWRASGWNLFLQGGFAAPQIRILVAEPAAASIAGLAGLRLTIPLLLLGTMAFAAWLAIAQLRRYLRPLETLTSATRQLSASNFDVQVLIQTGDELADLGENFNRMARSLREQHRELQQRAHVDGLTGLSNRDFFHQQLRERLTSGEPSALLYIDLDEFKKVNDSAGHEAGDRLLQEAAARLRGCLQIYDMVARLGGDEFAILLGAGAGRDQATAAGARLLRAMQDPIRVAGAERRVSASIGIALIPAHGQTVDVLLRNADIAMYQAKELGRNGVAFFSPEMHRRMQERISVEIALAEAVERDELRLHYQPLVSAGRLSGVEALVRWVRPSGELVSPAEFIPIAEQSGLIVAIGDWVIDQACADFARWRAAGIAPGYVSINVAPRQLESSLLPERLQRLMLEQQMHPRQIQLEVTESALANGARAAATLQRLHTLGVRLALDDFGTGYSSLGQLQRLPFDVVKIDRSFIIDLPDSSVALQLVRTILRMTQSLEKLSVAEGVETEAQRELLQALGCDAMQGYLFGEPAPEQQIRALLQRAADDPLARRAQPKLLARG